MMSVAEIKLLKKSPPVSSISGPHTYACRLYKEHAM